jgi:hypothetical protein
VSFLVALIVPPHAQPGLGEEFGQLVGVTPTEYLRSRLDGPNHLRFAGFR